MVIKRKNKLTLNRSEEFEILKLIFDKLLWVGTIASLYGLYVLFQDGSDPSKGLLIVGVGAFFLFLFTSIVIGTINFPKKE